VDVVGGVDEDGDGEGEGWFKDTCQSATLAATTIITAKMTARIFLFIPDVLSFSSSIQREFVYKTNSKSRFPVLVGKRVDSK
jgi:hypothetical protein